MVHPPSVASPPTDSSRPDARCHLQLAKKEAGKQKRPIWMHSAGLRGMLSLPRCPSCTLATASGFAKPRGFLCLWL
jgi:hypothetical protein